VLTIITIAQAFLLADIIVAAFQQEKSVSELTFKICMVALLFIARASSQFLGEIVSSKMSQRICNELRTGLFGAIFKSNPEIIRQKGAGQISLLATRGIANLEPYFSRFMPQLFISLFVPLVVGITIASRDLLSGLVVLCTIALIPLFGALIGKFTATAMDKKWKTLGLLSTHLFDLLSGLTTLRVFGRVDKQEKQIELVGDRYRKETMGVLRISFLSSLVLELIATLSVALLAVQIGIRLIDAHITLFNGLVVLILAPEVYWPLRNIAAYFHAAADGVKAAEEIYEILETPTAVAKSAKIESLNNISEIKWNQLTVEYSNSSAVNIPAGHLLPGKLNVITGPSGIGKSTLFALLMGFKTPSSGEIEVWQGENRNLLGEIDISNWRSEISWVPQAPHFPKGALRETFLKIDPKLSDPQIWELLHPCGISSADLMNGLDTPLGDFVDGVSVGQKRRIALARALLRNSAVFLLDEPTASIDDFNEDELLTLFHKLKNDQKIVVVISHRARVIEAAEYLLNFEKSEKK
jgi:ATP-binding cassette subfamily C protein CydCD